jgi:small-conductance mechanosensitive channel
MLRSARQLSRATILATLFFATILAIPVSARQPSSPPSEAPVGYPVTVEGNEIFRIYEGVGSITAQERAASVSERIRKLIYTKDDLSQIKGSDSPYGTAVMLGDNALVVVTEEDAKHYHVTRQVLANYLAQRVRNVLTESRRERTPRFLIQAALKATGTLAIYLTLVWLVVRIGRWLLRRLQATATRMKGIRIQQSQIMAGERIAAMAMTAVRLLRILLLFLFTWILLATVFNYFPWTRQRGRQLLGYILTPVEVIGRAFVNYLPNLVYIIVIVAVIYYVMKFLRLVAGEIERGKIRIHGFYPEWAQPTYKIVRFLLFAFTAVVIYPYLPGENSPAFKGVGIFIGVLFSLGSTSAVANVVAGVILTYTRGFRVGDWVKIGDNMGEVTGQTMLATHLKTIKNEEIIIPNSVILGSYVTNYSLLAQNEGLILYTSATTSRGVRYTSC